MRTIRIEAKAKLILTVPDAGNRSPEDIVLQAEQHINDKASIFDLTSYKGTEGTKKVKVGIRIHVDGSRSSIRVD